MPAKRKVRSLRRPRKWRAVQIDTAPALFRLIGPGFFKGRRQLICVAIGSKRLKKIADALNAASLEV